MILVMKFKNYIMNDVSDEVNNYMMNDVNDEIKKIT